MSAASSPSRIGVDAFVFAAPRSGTTWLKQALNAHEAVYCTENRFFGAYSDHIYYARAGKSRLRVTLDAYVDAFLQPTHLENLSVEAPALREKLISAMLPAICSTLRDASQRPFLVDKVTPYPGTARVAYDAARSHFPSATFVHLVRDGRDMLTSSVFHWLTRQDANAGEASGDDLTDRRRRAFVDGEQIDLPRFFADSDIVEFASLWDETAALAEAEDDTVVRITYEQMIADQAGALRSIFSAIGADADEATLTKCVEDSSFERMSGGRAAGQADPTAHVRKGVAGDWRNWFTRRDGELFHQIAGARLKAHGYVDADEWYAELPERLGGTDGGGDASRRGLLGDVASFFRKP